jgi:C4-dicarboxylate-specific signal transduction histidine kinase
MRGLFKKARPAKEPLNINEAIEEVILLTRGEARRNKVALRMELTGNLPSVMADRVQVQQVVMNLILNGIQAISAVEDRERVLVFRTQLGEGDQFRVAVQDCGIGIDPANIERIFSTPRNPAAWVWGFRSVVRLLKVTGDGFGLLRTTVLV